jgi:uncharacterized protein YjbI with pentapeptide repeats
MFFLIAVAVIAILYLGYTRFPTIFGFGEVRITKETKHYDIATGEQTGVDQTEEVQPPRRVWDWLAIGLIGAAVAGVGYYYNRGQKEREQSAAMEQAQNTALQEYLSQMSNLVIDKGMGTKPKEHVCRVAQARTVAILLELDKDHKRRPLKLVYELGLIKKKEDENSLNPLITLSNAGLDHADLRELTLIDTCLRSADLRATDLTGADLEGSDLSEADFRGANLAKSNLAKANLSKANLLPYSELDPARLSAHNLNNIDPGQVKLNGDYTPTNLSGVNLSGANLRGANLSGANLKTAVGLTQEQIEQAMGNLETKFPDDLHRPEAWRKSFKEQWEEIRRVKT